jgi:hypothetical protein
MTQTGAAAPAAADGPAEPLRAGAETWLRALAGHDARLREDQWTAIRALVTDRRRALVVQRTGWGKCCRLPWAAGGDVIVRRQKCPRLFPARVAAGKWGRRRCPHGAARGRLLRNGREPGQVLAR